MIARRWILGTLTTLVLLVVALLAGAHILFAAHDSSRSAPPGTTRETLRQPDGKPLTVYAQPARPGTIPVILVHGTPGSATNFDAQFSAGIPGARLISYDRPGFAGSPGGDKQANLTYQTDTVLALIDQIAAGGAVLVGHSYGGPIVLNAALRAPRKVRGVVLVAGSVMPEMEKLWPIQRPANSPLLSWLVPAPLRACNREIIRLQPELTEMNTRFENLRTPVLALQGTNDTLVPPDNVPLLEKKLASVGQSHLLKTHMFPGWNHFMLWEHADTIDAAIARFIAGLPPGK